MTKIEGANLETVEGTYNDLSSYNWFDDKYTKNLIQKVSNMYYENCTQAENIEISPLEIDENNEVIIKRGMINHRCSSNMESLRSLANYGILASEWFGYLESEAEGRFCAFVSRMKGDEYPIKGSLAEDDYSRLNIGNDVILFFDSNNELMNRLLHLDYFEFENIKNKYPEKINEIYTPDEIEILEGLIESLSPCGKNMRASYDTKTNYWSAIPGGIPSPLVNGVCVKKMKYTEEELDEINNLFPNAVIFDNNKKVVRTAIKSNEMAH